MGELCLLVREEDDRIIANRRNRQGKLPMLETWSPKKFLYEVYSPNPDPKKCVDLFLANANQSEVRRCVNGLKNGNQFQPLIIDYYRLDDRSKIKHYFHDGRHRAVACMKMGVKEVPVYVWRTDNNVGDLERASV